MTSRSELERLFNSRKYLKTDSGRMVILKIQKNNKQKKFQNNIKNEFFSYQAEIRRKKNFQ